MPHTSCRNLTEEDLRWYLRFDHKRAKPTAEENKRHTDIKHRLSLGCFKCEYNQKLVVEVDHTHQVQVSVRVRVMCTVESIKKGSDAKPTLTKVSAATNPKECKRLRHLLGPRTIIKAKV